jgi:hypothetical protein
MLPMWPAPRLRLKVSSFGRSGVQWLIAWTSLHCEQAYKRLGPSGHSLGGVPSKVDPTSHPGVRPAHSGHDVDRVAEHPGRMLAHPVARGEIMLPDVGAVRRKQAVP